MPFPNPERPKLGRLPRSPAVARNREPIAEILGRYLPEHGSVLEIASGTGEHAVHFATRFPDIVWQPSDTDPAALAAIDAWRALTGGERRRPLDNLRPPLMLDVTRRGWTTDVQPEPPIAVIAINMIHIAPWRAAEGLLAGSGRLLTRGRWLFLYGPFRREGRHTAPSNAAFDAALRRQNAEWGVRDLEAVVETAARNGLVLEEVVEMPANNLSVVFIRR